MGSSKLLRGLAPMKRMDFKNVGYLCQGKDRE